jgi:hypothetical protein
MNDVVGSEDLSVVNVNGEITMLQEGEIDKRRESMLKGMKFKGNESGHKCHWGRLACLDACPCEEEIGETLCARGFVMGHVICGYSWCHEHAEKICHELEKSPASELVDAMVG